MSSVAVVVLNYNDAEMTAGFVDRSLSWEVRGGYELHIVVVDNCSTDGSYEELADRFANMTQIDVIQTGRNGGYAFGNNYGAKYAIEKYDSEVIVVSNPDISASFQVIYECIECFSNDPRVAVVAPIVKSRDGSFSTHSFKLPSYEDDLLACSISERIRYEEKETSDYIDQDRICLKTQMVKGCFLAIRSDVLVEIGFFDESTFLYCEERFLGRKLLEMGYWEILKTDAFVEHGRFDAPKNGLTLIRTWEMIYKERLNYQKAWNNITKTQELRLKTRMNLSLLKMRIRALLEKKNRGC